MALVHEQSQDSNKKFEKINGEVTFTKAQVQEMVNTIQQLTEEVSALKKDADIKGERRPIRIQQSTLPLPLGPTVQTIPLG